MKTYVQSVSCTKSGNRSSGNVAKRSTDPNSAPPPPRFCIDFRSLNSVTSEIQQPLEVFDDVIDALADAKPSILVYWIFVAHLCNYHSIRNHRIKPHLLFILVYIVYPAAVWRPKRKCGVSVVDVVIILQHAI